jgi:hypothetical protein
MQEHYCEPVSLLESSCPCRAHQDHWMSWKDWWSVEEEINPLWRHTTLAYLVPWGLTAWVPEPLWLCFTGGCLSLGHVISCLGARILVATILVPAFQACIEFGVMWNGTVLLSNLVEDSKPVKCSITFVIGKCSTTFSGEGGMFLQRVEDAGMVLPFLACLQFR